MQNAAIARLWWEVGVRLCCFAPVWWVVGFERKRKTGKCGKGLDIFSVLEYNRDREALTDSQRPPTVKITALFALEEL